MTKEMRASTAALAALAKTSRERTAVAFFHMPEMRDTPETVLFLQDQALKMLAAVGLGGDAPAASTVSAAASGADAVGGSGRASTGSVGSGRGSAGKVPGPEVFEIVDRDAEGEGRGEVRGGEPVVLGAVAAPPVEDVAAPPIEDVAAPPVTDVAAPPVTDVAAPPVEDVAPAGAQQTAATAVRGQQPNRWARAQMSKAVAAAKLLARNMETTLPLETGSSSPPSLAGEETETDEDSEDDGDGEGSSFE